MRVLTHRAFRSARGDGVEEFDQWFSQWRWNDNLFVIAHNSVDHVELVPAVVIVLINLLKVFGGFSYQGVSDSSQQRVLHGHDGDRMCNGQ